MPSLASPDTLSILHPTDFSEASHDAFAHALAVALRTEGQLTIVHVGSEHSDDIDWTRFPRVRRTLHAWGLLDEDSRRSDVFNELRTRVKKLALRGHDATEALVQHLDHHPSDLLVLATEGRSGLPRWVKQSVAEALARKTTTTTLFIPQGATGFVTSDSGTSTLERILLPVDHEPDPMAAVRLAEWTVRAMGTGDGRILLLHVADDWDLPTLIPQNGTVQSWEQLLRRGNPVEQIVGAAHELEADIILMATAGHHGALDALRGSTTERVLREAPCPVLAVPA
ncbi:MAG: universal stress protein, partial [Bacteroidetes bacterium]|nr:universal stress protein [Bacteroidota bacterium]